MKQTEEDLNKAMIGGITIFIIVGMLSVMVFTNGMHRGYNFARYEESKNNSLTEFNLIRYQQYKTQVKPVYVYDEYNYNGQKMSKSNHDKYVEKIENEKYYNSENYYTSNEEKIGVQEAPRIKDVVSFVNAYTDDLHTSRYEAERTES